MVKGFIFFRTGKIPFVIENYRMDLFTDDSLLEIFCKEYNFKENYILQGLCFDIGPHGRKATFLVEILWEVLAICVAILFIHLTKTKPMTA